MSKHSSTTSKVTLAGLLITLGIIYGDIGTSPLYVLSAVISDTVLTEKLILGALSCVFWTLTLQTTLKYIVLTLRADNKGEGGIFSLYSLVRKQGKWLIIIAIIGGAMLLADGIITPSITVSSAIYGLKTINPNIPTMFIVLSIISGIFLFQQIGASVVGKSFGPIMVVWFGMLAVFGVIQLSDSMYVLKAINPYYAYEILLENPKGLAFLGAIFLCTTGAEALYSDLGHTGRKNIYYTWIGVKICLILNYFGQGAYLLNHVGEVFSDNPFYAVMPNWFVPIGIGIATLASIVASQALISGSFTLVSEAISLNLFPKLRVLYPTNIKGQLYIPAVNTFLWIGCVIVVFYFKDPIHMEAAYGLAITITMLSTTILLLFYMKMKQYPAIITYGSFILFFTLESFFLLANAQKFMHGGYITLLIAGMLIFINWIMINAYNIKNKHAQYVKIKHYLDQIAKLSSDLTFPRYATHLVYLSKARNEDEVEKSILYSILQKQPKRAEFYWFINVQVVDDPFTMAYHVNPILKDDLIRVTFYFGFKVQQRISVFLRYVVNDMIEKGELNLNQQYHFLKEFNNIGDFQFIYLEEILSYESKESFREKFILTVFMALKKISASPEKWFGLDTSIVRAEKVPLIIRPITGINLQRIDDLYDQQHLQ